MLDLLGLVVWFALLFIIKITCFSMFCFALLTLLAWFARLGCLFYFVCIDLLCFALLCLLALVDLPALLCMLACVALLGYNMRRLTWLVMLVLARLELARLDLAWEVRSLSRFRFFIKIIKKNFLCSPSSSGLNCLLALLCFALLCFACFL